MEHPLAFLELENIESMIMEDVDLAWAYARTCLYGLFYLFLLKVGRTFVEDVSINPDNTRRWPVP